MKITRTNIILISVIIIAYLAMDIAFSNGDMSLIPFLIGLQAFTVLLTISPITETILRLWFGCRKIMTQKEQAQLLPLYEEVYASYLEQYPKARRNIKLFIDNSMDINAYAFGRKTIVITAGAIQFLNDEQIKGLLAHEFGHHCHGDTLIFPLLVVGNIVMIIVMFFAKICEVIMNLTNYMLGNQLHHQILAFLISFAFRVTYALITFLISCLILVNKRGSEYLADEFAMELGYGEYLKNALYMFQQMNIEGKKKTIIERMKASHPDTHIRIARLEQGLEYASEVA